MKWKIVTAKNKKRIYPTSALHGARKRLIKLARNQRLRPTWKNNIYWRRPSKWGASECKTFSPIYGKRKLTSFFPVHIPYIVTLFSRFPLSTFPTCNLFVSTLDNAVVWVNHFRVRLSWVIWSLFPGGKKKSKIGFLTTCFPFSYNGKN